MGKSHQGNEVMVLQVDIYTVIDGQNEEKMKWRPDDSALVLKADWRTLHRLTTFGESSRYSSVSYHCEPLREFYGKLRPLCGPPKSWPSTPFGPGRGLKWLKNARFWPAGFRCRRALIRQTSHLQQGKTGPSSSRKLHGRRHLLWRVVLVVVVVTTHKKWYVL